MAAPPPEIDFRPFGIDDLPLARRWLAEPHVRRWWGDPAEQLALLAQDIDEPRMSGFVFSLDGAPVGYLQAYPAAEWDGHPFGALAEDAVAVDMFMGEPGLLGQGIGSSVMRAFARRLTDAGARRVLIDPDPENGRAIRAYEKAGFVRVGTAMSGDGPALVMCWAPTLQRWGFRPA